MMIEVMGRNHTRAQSGLEQRKEALLESFDPKLSFCKFLNPTINKMCTGIIQEFSLAQNKTT